MKPIVIGLLILLIIYFLYTSSTECYTYINLLTPDQTFHTIASNTAFWSLLTDKEWHKRKVNNLPEYLHLIQPTLIALTSAQKAKLIRLCNQADQRLAHIHLPYFSGKKAAQIQWNIGVFKGTAYEYGWPHTIGNVILFPLRLIERGDTSDIETLIHEKAHVYQRLYPSDLDTYLSTHHFTKWKRRSEYDPDRRPNPDTDDWVYTHNGQVMTEDLRSHVENPDPNPQYYEHPFERMAIEIGRIGIYRT